MSLNIIATLLLVPPLNLLFLMLAGLALQQRSRVGTWLIAACLAGLFVLALPVASILLIASLEQDLPLTPPKGTSPGAIVILGGDTARGVNDTFDVGPLTLERIRAGARLYHETGLPILVTGGTVDDAPPIAPLMAQALTQDFAVPSRWVEAKSLTTWDNAAQSAALLRAAHISTVYLVTQAWHMKRAVVAFRHFGVTVVAAPTLIDRPATFGRREFIPRVSSWERSYFALHEWVGYAFYALR